MSAEQRCTLPRWQSHGSYLGDQISGKFFTDFLTIKVIPRVIFQNWPRSRLCAPVPIHYSLTILSFHVRLKLESAMGCRRGGGVSERRKCVTAVLSAVLNSYMYELQCAWRHSTPVIVPSLMIRKQSINQSIATSVQKFPDSVAKSVTSARHRVDVPGETISVSIDLTSAVDCLHRM